MYWQESEKSVKLKDNLTFMLMEGLGIRPQQHQQRRRRCTEMEEHWSVGKVGFGCHRVPPTSHAADAAPP